MEYKIATSEDIDEMMGIRMEMLRVVNKLSGGQDFSEEFLSFSRQYFLTGNQVTCLAIDKGTVIGCASISYIEVMPTYSHVTGKRAHLMNVYTREEYRRQGIAGKLVQMLIDDAKRKGATEISLDSTDSGRSLYRNLGFRASEECMVMNL